MNETAPLSPGQALDRALHALTAQAAGGISPSSSIAALADWTTRLTLSPGRVSELATMGLRSASAFWTEAMGAAWRSAQAGDDARKTFDDPRFAAPEWASPPFSLWAGAFLSSEAWWRESTRDLSGLNIEHQKRAEYLLCEMLDGVSPSNFPFANPVVLKRTMETGGLNFLTGWRRMLEAAAEHTAADEARPRLDFLPGRDVAVTEGRVVFRNHLIELIQYAPTTPRAHAEPILIVPAWIMKYYILDLSPRNSLVRYLVERGHTVFMISWRNVHAEDRDLSMEDYRLQGPMAAVGFISGALPGRRIHAAGYCLGGTLTAIAAAAMARDGDERLKSLSLFAAQTDFTEAGDLRLFITEDQLATLRDMMWAKGYLDGGQMAGAFQLLRPNELIWARMIKTLYLGEGETQNDLMSWNADTTRMPYRMHTDYLRAMYLNNDLAEGHFEAGGKAVALGDLDLPIFVVGTEQDHVAPWRSVYKIHLTAPSAEVTFLLTSGGHNAGVVSPPGHANRHYRLRTRLAGGMFQSPDEWLDGLESHEGSWWEAWDTWLACHASGEVEAPTPAAGLAAAPGDYVMQY